MEEIRIRTVNTAYEEIKEKDPGTSITKNAIRAMLRSGVIPCFRMGNKQIFRMEDLEKVVSGKTV